MDEYFSSAFANEFEHVSKDVFRTLSNTYDEAFLWK